MFEVAVENGFEFLSEEYRQLFAASEATAFQHPVWLSGLYRGLLSYNDARPLIVTIRRVDGSLAAVLPLLKRRYGALRAIEFADLRVSDYVAPVTDRSTLVGVLADSRARRRIRSALGSFDLLRISKIREGALPIHRLFGIAEPIAMATNAYAVPLGRSYEAWASIALNASYGRELEKKARQLARAGTLRFERVVGNELDRTFDALRTFRHDRFEARGGDVFQIPIYYDFYRRMADATDFARTYRLTLDDEIIAGALGLAYRGELLVVLSGFTQTAFKNKSIGSLLFREIVRDGIASGDTVLDFTIGDEPYKMTFGGVPSPMWQISQAGSPFGLVAAILVDRLPPARALARSIFHRTRPRGPKDPPPARGVPAGAGAGSPEAPVRS